MICDLVTVFMKKILYKNQQTENMATTHKKNSIPTFF